MFLLLLIVFTSHLDASVYITITGTNVKRARLAVGEVQLLPDAPVPDPTLARKVRDEVISDLELMNLFEFLPETSFSELDHAKDFYNINFDALANSGATFYLKLGYRLSGNKLSVEAILYDIAGRKKIFATRYQYQASQYYRLVHTLSDDILHELTGERGLFLGRIAMVCWNPKRKSPPKEIFIVDSDGRNLTQLTFDDTLSLSPSWSPDGKALTYTQFEWRRFGKLSRKAAVLKKHTLATGQRITLSAREGMNSGASWMPDGKRVAATLSFTGRPEIFFLDPNGKENPEPFSRHMKWTKVTGELNPEAMNLLFDVEPNFSPDGKKMVLSSARSGHPMIYTVDLESKVSTQLTFAGQYNASPAWSSRGDKIIFAAQRTGEGNFDLYVIDPDGNNLARVTNGERSGRGVNSENPSWAPTGRHIAYSNNDSGTYAIFTMSLDGNIRRKVSPSNRECKTPTWGPKE